jgi:CHAD domain-containing protein
LSFRFKSSDSTFQAGFRRIACAQLDEMLDLGRSHDSLAAQIVHQIRRRCKAMRGLLRLVKPAFPGYAFENRAFRDVAAALSGARDSQVLIETLDGLLSDETLMGGPTIAALRKQWADEGRMAAKASATQIEHAVTALLAIRVRAEGWFLIANGDEAIMPGLRRTYRKARDAMQAVEEATDISVRAASHEWRKEVKYHWQHMRLLGSVAPAIAKKRIKQADRLGDILGYRHDLDLLIARLEGEAEVVPEIQKLINAANKRAAHLTRKAEHAGEALFSEDSSDFMARWRSQMRHLA